MQDSDRHQAFVGLIVVLHPFELVSRLWSFVFSYFVSNLLRVGTLSLVELWLVWSVLGQHGLGWWVRTNGPRLPGLYFWFCTLELAS